MSVQLENKNENIQRLEDELQQIKIEHSNASIPNNLSNDRNKKSSFRSYGSLKKLMRNDSENRSIHNESGDNISLNDMSIGSLLGNLNKSRYGSSSKFDASCECSCGFKNKYLKYKSLHDSLKNQLDIVK